MFDHEPQNWIDLQSMVAQAFKEMGCQVDIEKDITTARGKVNVDVHVIDRSQKPDLKYLCECKYWNSKVPKSVFHSFRSVISDSGAHLGLIISKCGFQRGAYSSAVNTNVKLYSWNEFVKVYENRWTKSIFNYLEEQSDALQRYCTNPEAAERFPPKGEQPDQFIHSWTKNFKRAVSMRGIWFNISSSIARNDSPTDFPNLDLPDSDEWVVINSKREGYEYIKPRLLSCRQEFEKLAGKLIDSVLFQQRLADIDSG